MRAIMITCSIVAALALLVLGGFLNAVSGFGFDTQLPYNDPARVVATLVGDLPGLTFALVGLGFALYDAARRGTPGWFIGLLFWPVVPVVAASLMYAGALAYVSDWFVALAFLPLASLVYGLLAFPAVPASVPTSVPAAVPAVPGSAAAVGGTRSAARSPLRFLAFVGVLALVTLGGTALLIGPNLQPGISPPSGPPALQVSEPNATADCAKGVYPPVTLTNTGTQLLQWAAKSEDPQVTATPAGGSLAPGTSVHVAFSGTTTAPDVIVQFVTGGGGGSGGGGGVAKFGCQPGTGK